MRGVIVGLGGPPVKPAPVYSLATDLARESADIVLPEHALANLPWLFEMAMQVRSSIRANLAWALGYNVVALALAACGLLQPILAAGLMAGSSLVVVTRSLSAQRGLALPSADRAAVTETASA